MADTFKGIITADGKKRQLPYGNVLETPVSDETLSIQGGFADAKIVGGKFAKVNETTDSLKEDIDNVISSQYRNINDIIQSGGILINLELEVGGLDLSSGKTTTNTNSFRSKTYINVGMLNTLTNNTDLDGRLGIAWYDKEKVFKGYVSDYKFTKGITVDVLYPYAKFSFVPTSFNAADIDKISVISEITDFIVKDEIEKNNKKASNLESSLYDYKNNSVVIEPGYVTKKHTIGESYDKFYHAFNDVIEGSKIKITCSGNGTALPYIWFDKNNKYVGDYTKDANVSLDSDTSIINFETTVPIGATKIGINSLSKGNDIDFYKYVLKDFEENEYIGKTAVFFGTSIPAGTVSFDGGVYSIPTYVGKILGMTVINESLGSSIACRGFYNAKTDTDQYGWTGKPWQNVFLSMGANLTEKQDLIDNYSSKWASLLGGDFSGANGDGTGTGKPTEMTEYWKNQILKASYENKLIPYLDGTKQMPDLFIFEHGHNDYDYSVSGGGFSPIPSVNPDNIADYDRSKYGDAMAFYFRLIWQFNPQAKILVVSHYADDNSSNGKGIFNAQKEMANYLGVPFCDVANNIGWTQQKISTSGYWGADGIWVESGGTLQTLTRLNQCLKDGLHPHSDKSGNAIKREAQVIAKFIMANINLN